MTTFIKLDDTNCVYGRITQGPGSSIPGSYNYLGKFDSYEQCSQSNNIPSSAKAITYHNDKNKDYADWAKQCYSINDTNTQVPNQNYATCGIVAPNSPRQTAAPVNAPTVPTQVMGDSSNLDASVLSTPVQDNSMEQIIAQISNLQDLENQKYDDLNILLASNPTPDNVVQQNVLISDITHLTNIRSQLFDTLVLNTQNNARVNDAMNANVQDKHTIVTLKENDLNARRSAIAALNQESENTQRMVDINVYYKKQYEARVKIMKYIVLLCFLVIFFVVLSNLGWLPQEMVIVLVVIIILAGGLYIGSLVNDAYQRSNMNYDEYNWGFDSQKMASMISKQPRHKKSASTDRTCNSGSGNSGSGILSQLDSMYKSVSSSAASVEGSIKSSISAASTATTGPDTASSPPSVQSKISESFMLSKMPRKYFSDIQGQGANPFTMEDNYGKI